MELWVIRIRYEFMYLQICLWLPMQLFTCMSIWRLELCYVNLGHVFHTDYVVGWPSLQHPLSLLFYILIIILMGVILDVDLSINKYWQWLIINILLDVLKDIYIELLLLLYPWNFCLITGKYNYFCNFFPPYLGLMKKLYSIRRFREKKKVPCRNKAKMFFPTISNFSGEVMFFKSVQIKMQQNNFSNHLWQTYGTWILIGALPLFKIS